MNFNNDFKYGIINNPLLNSPFFQNNYGRVIAPGDAHYIVTENLLKISAEDGNLLITET